MFRQRMSQRFFLIRHLTNSFEILADDYSVTQYLVKSLRKEPITLSDCSHSNCAMK